MIASEDMIASREDGHLFPVGPSGLIIVEQCLQIAASFLEEDSGRSGADPMGDTMRIQ
jgi:hypothetical protein